MKRLVATALVALMLASCQEAPKGYVINGEVTGRTEGKVYLKSFRNKMFFDVDTAELIFSLILFIIFLDVFSRTVRLYTKDVISLKSTIYKDIV